LPLGLRGRDHGWYLLRRGRRRWQLKTLEIGVEPVLIAGGQNLLVVAAQAGRVHRAYRIANEGAQARDVARTATGSACEASAGVATPCAEGAAVTGTTVIGGKSCAAEGVAYAVAGGGIVSIG